MDLTQLPNLGPKLAQDLEKAGITSPQELKNIGAKAAFLRMGLSGMGCLSKLCALEGAIQGVRWHDLSPECKADLKAFLASQET